METSLFFPQIYRGQTAGLQGNVPHPLFPPFLMNYGLMPLHGNPGFFLVMLGWKFYDADDYHSEENRMKMGRGVPLSDQDRIPWLCSLHDILVRLVDDCEFEDSQRYMVRPCIIIISFITMVKPNLKSKIWVFFSSLVFSYTGSHCISRLASNFGSPPFTDMHNPTWLEIRNPEQTDPATICLTICYLVTLV
uniref:probable gluconokinase isoform X2 n=1 Tax=Myodes glareolus TaxID=447135 RepID=UPI0020202985|nr:probable gluconokinase isoform X2 [Myodes glareolus]